MDIIGTHTQKLSRSFVSVIQVTTSPGKIQCIPLVNLPKYIYIFMYIYRPTVCNVRLAKMQYSFHNDTRSIMHGMLFSSHKSILAWLHHFRLRGDLIHASKPTPTKFDKVLLFGNFNHNILLDCLFRKEDRLV